MSVIEYFVRLEERKESKRKRESFYLYCGILYVNESNIIVRKGKFDKYNKNISEVLKIVLEFELVEELNE